MEFVPPFLRVFTVGSLPAFITPYLYLCKLFSLLLLIFSLWVLSSALPNRATQLMSQVFPRFCLIPFADWAGLAVSARGKFNEILTRTGRQGVIFFNQLSRHEFYFPSYKLPF